MNGTKQTKLFVVTWLACCWFEMWRRHRQFYIVDDDDDTPLKVSYCMDTTCIRASSLVDHFNAVPLFVQFLYRRISHSHIVNRETRTAKSFPHHIGLNVLEHAFVLFYFYFVLFFLTWFAIATRTTIPHNTCYDDSFTFPSAKRCIAIRARQAVHTTKQCKCSRRWRGDEVVSVFLSNGIVITICWSLHCAEETSRLLLLFVSKRLVCAMLANFVRYLLVRGNSLVPH